MSVQNQLNQMLDVAVRNQNAITRNLLRTVLGDVQTISRRTGEQVTDALLIKTIKGFIENNNQSLALRESEALSRENEILNSLLPKQMTDAEIRSAIQASNGTTIGEIMKYLSAHHSGLYNGKSASAMATDWLSS